VKQPALSLLLIEDNHGDARLLREMLGGAGDQTLALTWVQRLATAFESLSQQPPDLILLDLSLPESTGLDTFGRVQDLVPDIPIIILTGLNDQSLALRAVQMGAQDYLVKGSIDTNLLLRSINYAVERHRLQMKLRNLSLTDELTGLHNRRGFVTFAEHHLKLARRIRQGFWLFYIDLDRFKEINDGHGHQEGDRALLRAAQLLQECFRASDVIARIGGDEFVVLAMSEPDSSPQETVGRIEASLRKHNGQNNLPYRLSFSVGFSRWDPSSVTSIEELMSFADQELYRAKQRR